MSRQTGPTITGEEDADDTPSDGDHVLRREVIHREPVRCFLVRLNESARASRVCANRVESARVELSQVTSSQVEWLSVSSAGATP
jgi:hypothetical protein